MTWDKGFDFRASSGFVTDPTDCTYVLASDTSPTTRNGATFGWTNAAGLDSRDRTTSGDTRLSGMNFVGAPADWTLTLPATGDYDVYLAGGDQAAQQIIKLQVYDNTTVFITLTNVDTLAADSYVGATGVSRTRAQWVADSARGGTKVTRTFASTTLKLTLDTPTAASSCLAHVFVSQVAAADSGIAKSYFTQFPKPILRQPLSQGRLR